MYKPLFIVTMFSFWAGLLSAQNDSSFYELKEVTVTGFKEEQRLETSTSIVSISAEKMKDKGAFNVADGLAKLPGISQLSTGVAISKPVIRGLYGNRVLTLLSGLRFDNQQWQDEHGLGLSSVGIDRVEVIKGPLSILYGTDAVGGVLNVIEEKPAPVDKLAIDINTTFHSNTLGNATDIGFKGNRGGNRWWRFRAGYETHGDYADGANNRVLNSRFGGYYAKGTYGLRKGHITSVNNYNFSYNNFGFILNDILDFIEPDARWSRSTKGPHHLVIFNVFSSQNTVALKNSILKFNAGVQTNNRMEDEGGGQISLNMLLATVLYNLQWSKIIHPNIEMIISHGSTFENNTNFGARKIIPDAFMYEVSGSAFFKFKLPVVVFEAGAGLNDKWIKTVLTPGVNSADKLIKPFAKNWISANGMLGLTVNPSAEWNIKLNTSTGFRAPNLAELSSNGLHEGIFTYEIGDPKMKSEQNINTDLSVAYNSSWISFSAGGFYNRFFNYIYLQPTGGDFYGFPIFEYRQQHAQLYGGELEWELTPQDKAKGIEWSMNASTIIGKTADGNYLPYIPATKVGSQFKYVRDITKAVKKVYGSVELNYVFEQNRPAPYETTTPGYYLLNAAVGANFTFKKGGFNLSVVGNNLLGAKYFDHLSRFKAYGIYNIGRNIVVNISIPLLFNYSPNKHQTK